MAKKPEKIYQLENGMNELIGSGTTHILLQEASDLLNQWHEKSAGPLRLLGFGTSGLSPEGMHQQLLFADPEEEKQKNIDAAFDKIREKYGDDSVRRGQQPYNIVQSEL